MPSARRINWRFALRAASLWGLLLGLGLYALWPWLPWAHAPFSRTLVVYGFSVVSDVMNEAIFPAFAARWRQETGEEVEFISSFAGSGTIANQIILGVPAEVAILALESDALRLAEKGVVSGPTWHELPQAGVLNLTPFIILVRPGNPRGIRDFADLARPGVGVVHPDPLTSGGANWAILAEYGAGVRPAGGDPEAGHQLLLGIWRNVVAQAASARAARTQFENGFGDALITYEQEALWDQQRGRLRAEIVYPHSTVLSEHTVVVVDRNVTEAQRPLVDAFVAFLWSAEAQRIFVRYGFRSADAVLNRDNPAFGSVPDPFRVGDLGGWRRAKPEIIEAIWRKRVLTELGR